MQILFDVLRQYHYGNNEFSQNHPYLKPKETKPIVPSVLWIGCSDSQVIPHEVLGLQSGEVLVYQNIANQVRLEDAGFRSILQYALEELHIKRIIICGHYECSGVRLALKAFDQQNEYEYSDNPFSNWVNEIKYLAYRHWSKLHQILDFKMRCQRLVELNVLAQAQKLYQDDNFMNNQDDVKIIPWIFDQERYKVVDLSCEYDRQLITIV